MGFEPVDHAGLQKNLHLGVPMRLLLKGHSFTSEYWKDLHRGLVDLARQKGFPPLFSTHAPFEWNFPNHCFIVDAMAKARQGAQPTRSHSELLNASLF